MTCAETTTLYMGDAPWEAAIREGIRRHNVTFGKGRRRNMATLDRGKALQLDKIGAIGEMAVAILLGWEDRVFADSRPAPGPDLPSNIEVKTRSKHWYELPIQKKCDPGKDFVLVTMTLDQLEAPYPHCVVRGWIPGYVGKDEKYWKLPPGGGAAYFVPHDVLLPFSTLSEKVHAA